MTYCCHHLFNGTQWYPKYDTTGTCTTKLPLPPPGSRPYFASKEECCQSTFASWNNRIKVQACINGSNSATSTPTASPTQKCFPDKSALQTAVYNCINQNCANDPNCATHTEYGVIGTWCVKLVTSMSNLFNGLSSFNSDISNWNVSSVTDMYGMFVGASSFNSDISNWDVSSVTNMGGMFYSATNFNQNLCPWDPKLPSNFNYTTYANNMFYNTGCPNKTKPTGRTGPWCAVTNCTA